jgi:hypothetical protein
MSLRELCQILRPRKFEPQFLRDLITIFNKRQRMNTINFENEVVRIIRTNVFKAFLGGKLEVVRKLGERYDYSIGDHDLTVIQTLRARYIMDFLKIAREETDEARARRRIEALAVAATWDSYNKGKLSSFRQRVQGKIGELTSRGGVGTRAALRFAGKTRAAQFPLSERIYWVTSGDEKVCEICSAFEAESIARNGWDAFDPHIPSIPYDSHPFCRCEYETLETYG